jgi:hypothetical protein
MAAAPPTQRDEDIVAYASFVGLRNDIDPERLSLEELAQADNVDIDKSGRVSRRVGRTKLSAVATHSLWSDKNLLGFCVQGSQLMQVNPLTYALTPVRTDLTAGLRVSYAGVNGVAYLSNGAQTGVVQNGLARSWGLPVPPLPFATLGTGNMPAGTYQYVTTYVRVDGQESGARRAAKIDVGANGALVFTLVPSVDPGVVSQNVYLTTPNGSMLYQALTVPNATTSATYANDTSELNYELKTQYLSAPPVGHLAAYYRGRMYMAVDDVIFPSQPYAYELFDLREFIPMPGRVTLMAGMEDKELYERGHNSGFFLGTDATCGILVGSDPSTFQYVPKTDYGAVMGAVDFVDGSLYGDNSVGARMLPMWLSTQGVCVGMPQLEIRNLTRSRYGFPVGAAGAALFMPGPNRFIAVSNF